MDLHHDLAFEEAETPGDGLVQHPVDPVHLDEVVAGPEGPGLVAAAFARPGADRGGIGPGQAAALLGALEIGLRAEPLADRPARAGLQDRVHIRGLEPHVPALADPARAVGLERRCERVEVRFDLAELEPAREQAHPAVDVVADPARGDDPVGQLGCDHAADREPVPLVHVGHGEHVGDHAREGRRVHELLQAAVAHGLRHERFVGVNARGHAHVRPEGGRDLPEVAVEPDDVADVDQRGLLVERAAVTRRRRRWSPTRPPRARCSTRERSPLSRAGQCGPPGPRARPRSRFRRSGVGTRTG